jgi:hypothetical protein
MLGWCRRRRCRLLVLFLLLTVLPTGRSQPPPPSTTKECFGAEDGYHYAPPRRLRLQYSVLGKAVRDYVNGDSAVRIHYGAMIGDWCVDHETGLNYISYGLEAFDAPLAAGTCRMRPLWREW